MNSLPITCKDEKTTFLLARRAERLARPIVERITGGMLSVEMSFNSGHYYRTGLAWHVGINVHRVNGRGDLGHMALQASHIRNSAELERAIKELEDVAKRDELSRQVASDGQ